MLAKIKADAPKNSSADMLYGGVGRGFSGENLLGLNTEAVTLTMDSQNFTKLSKYAYAQVGLADVFHLLAAEFLKCDFFFTRDQDFHRLRSEIESDFSFKLLYKDEGLAFLKSTFKSSANRPFPTKPPKPNKSSSKSKAV